MLNELDRRNFLKLSALGGAIITLSSLPASSPNRPDSRVLHQESIPSREFAGERYKLFLASLPSETSWDLTSVDIQLKKVGTLLEYLLDKDYEYGSILRADPLSSGTYGVHFKYLSRFPMSPIKEGENQGSNLVFFLEKGEETKESLKGKRIFLVPVNLEEGFPPTYFTEIDRSKVPFYFDPSNDVLVSNPKGGNVVVEYDSDLDRYTYIWEANGKGPYPLLAEFRPVGDYLDSNSKTWIPRLSLDVAARKVVLGKDMNSFYEGVVQFRTPISQGHFFVKLLGNSDVTRTPSLSKEAAVIHYTKIGDRYLGIMLRIPRQVDYRNAVISREKDGVLEIYTLAHIERDGEIQIVGRYRPEIDENNLSNSFLEPIDLQTGLTPTDK